MLEVLGVLVSDDELLVVEDDELVVEELLDVVEELLEEDGELLEELILTSVFRMTAKGQIALCRVIRDETATNKQSV